MSFRLVLNPGFEEELLRSPTLIPVLRKKAGEVAAEAKRFAPRARSLQRGRRRHYADGIAATAGYDDDGHVIGRVNAFHFTSVIIEYGSVHNPPRSPLRLGLDASRDSG